MLKLRTCVWVAGLFCAFQSTAQDQKASLLIQSPDGKTPELLWYADKWEPQVTGFDIKRKEGVKEWVKLNTEPILPGISAKKKLSVVESDKTRESMIRSRLLKLIAAHKLQETDNTTFLQKLNSGDKALEGMLGTDYDMALVSGFGFIDHSATRKVAYQYGLFAQGTDRLLASVSWNYGEIPDLNVVTGITSRSVGKLRGVQVYWNADVAKMKAAHVAGFNIYREGIRLNTVPIAIPDEKDSSEFSWTDKSAFNKSLNQYSISAESVFGIEGIIRPYTYNPADHPVEYKATEVTLINSVGYYFKDGINVKWNFPKEYERFIKGFIVEKSNLPQPYQRVSGLIEAQVRTYIDKTPSPVNEYIAIRVIAVYKDKTEEPGLGKLYSYLPVTEPPAPQHLLARRSVREGKQIIELSWDTPIYGDTMTSYYHVYLWDPVNDRFAIVQGSERLTARSFRFVGDDSVRAYKFVVTAVGRNDAESSKSNTAVVQLGEAK